MTVHVADVQGLTNKQTVKNCTCWRTETWMQKKTKVKHTFLLKGWNLPKRGDVLAVCTEPLTVEMEGRNTSGLKHNNDTFIRRLCLFALEKLQDSAPEIALFFRSWQHWRSTLATTQSHRQQELKARKNHRFSAARLARLPTLVGHTQKPHFAKSSE